MARTQQFESSGWWKAFLRHRLHRIDERIGYETSTLVHFRNHSHVVGLLAGLRIRGVRHSRIPGRVERAWPIQDKGHGLREPGMVFLHSRGCEGHHQTEGGELS